MWNNIKNIKNAIVGLNIFLTPCLTHQFLKTVTNHFAIKHEALIKCKPTGYLNHFLNIVKNLIFNMSEVIKHLAITTVTNSSIDIAIHNAISISFARGNNHQYTNTIQLRFESFLAFHFRATFTISRKLATKYRNLVFSLFYNLVDSLFANASAKITPNTRAIVIINPNNPTGALYPDSLLREIVELARKHGLIIYADEVYDKVLYDGVTHTSIGSLSEDVLTITFNGLSKNYRSCGYRAGWMIVSGDKRPAHDYIEGLNMLASMRLCANVPGQYAIQTALGGYQSINDLVGPGGRMLRQRNLAHELITAIPGVTCVKPKATLYMFPKLDPKLYPIEDDQAFIGELLTAERVLLVQGTGFNWPKPDHFRLVFLPHEDDLRDAIARIARFLDGYRRRHA